LPKRGNAAHSKGFATAAAAPGVAQRLECGVFRRFWPRLRLPIPLTDKRAFTLLEMLTVITIIGILAAIIGPSLGNFKPNVTAAATEQLLTDIGRARQLAISQHTTVYMVFLPPGFMQDPAYPPNASVGGTNYWAKGLTLLDKQMTGYNFVSLRNVGDQPGQHTCRYWSSWKSLPEGAFISSNKFALPLPNQFFGIYTNKPPGAAGSASNYTTVPWFSAFSNTFSLPFPTEQTPPLVAGTVRHWTTLPYIAFNYLGQLVQLVNGSESLRPSGEIIPLAKGSVLYPHDPATKMNNPALLPSAREVPPGNSTISSFNLICIDRLTGHAYVKRQEVR
jgi:prepilin-type N-terminal cleavage/methylation domain-containing protein